MLRPSRVTAIAVALITVTATSGVAQAAPTLTYQQIVALSPEDQASILDPLRAVANAAGAVGRAKGSDLLAGIQINAPLRTVDIFLTDTSRQADFLSAMRAADPAADFAPARFHPGSYSIANLKTAAARLVTQPGLESVAVNPDGSGLRVRAFNAAKTKQSLTSVFEGIPVVVEQAAADVTNLSRTRDTADWISGEALTWTNTPSNKFFDCTSGLPLRRISDGVPFLVTAAHCYPDLADVYTGRQNGNRNYVGYVAYRDSWNDAIGIDTGFTGLTASQEWDGPARGAPTQHVYDVEGTAWSYSGDATCQDGFETGIRCGLVVTNSVIYWTDPDNGSVHIGVEAHQVDGLLAGDTGDSGGLVFALVALNGGVSREARGIVSVRYKFENLRWTEAPAILSSFGMYLAPG